MQIALLSKSTLQNGLKNKRYIKEAHIYISIGYTQYGLFRSKIEVYYGVKDSSKDIECD